MFCFISTNIQQHTDQIGIPAMNITVTAVRQDEDKIQADSLLFVTKQKGL